jgi:transmembrane sensor
MDESQFKETLVERYLNNQATDQELEVFLELLRRGELDDLVKDYMNREADDLEDTKTGFLNSSKFKPWIQWLQVAASISFILW